MSSLEDHSSPRPEPSADDVKWRGSVEKMLGDVSFEDALVSRILGDLEIEPLYTARALGDDFDRLAMPGQAPYTRGRGLDASWRIGLEVAHPWTEEAAEAMRADQRRGVRLLWLRMAGIVSPGVWELETATRYNGVSVIGVDDVEKLVAALEPGTEVVLYSGEQALATAAMWVAAARRRDLSPQDFRGSFGCDPLGDLVDGGSLQSSLERAFRQMVELANWADAEAPSMRSTMVSASIYHDAGASAVDELAFAIATGVDYLRRLTAGGLTLDAAARQLDFSFSVGREVFLEIAKLRAARLLWSKVTQASGVSESGQAMRLHARTSDLETARVGPWMNLLRGAAQSFAAALGGADTIRTAPWDEALGWPDDQGRRLAANVQHMLAEEVRLDRVVDAAGGSWYLESLTDQLARRAWTQFRWLESRGGMTRCVTRGLVAERVRASATSRRESAATRTAPIIGASAFANLAEEPFAPKLPLRQELPRRPLHDLAEESGSISIQELLDLEDIHLEREIGEMKHIDAMLAAVGLSMEAPGEPGELMELAIAAAAAGARGEQILKALVEDSERSPDEDGPALECEPVERFRPALPFERLRWISDRWLEIYGRRPRALLLYLTGNGADRRSVGEGFVRRLFAVGGVESVEGGEVSAAEVARRFAESEAEALVIFGADSLHGEITEVATQIRRQGALIFVAGLPGAHEAAFADAGISGFVYEGCDVPRLLRPLHERLESRGKEPATPRGMTR